MAIKMITEKTGYIDDVFTKVGLIFSKNGVITIDNGWGRKQGVNILKELEAIDKKIVAIVNTHTHLDHAGANSFLQRETGCDIYCTLYESLIVRGEANLFAELFEGSMYPIRDGLSIFKSFEATNPTIIEPETKITIDGVTLEIIGIPGHSDGHIGVVHENILFCGDAVMGVDEMKASKLMFITNPPKQRETLNRLKNSSYSMYIPSHGEPFCDPSVTCDLVSEMIEKVEKYIFEIIREPRCLDDIVAYGATKFNIHANNINSYHVARTVIQTILHSLVESDRVDYLFKDNVMLFKALSEGEVRAAKRDKINKRVDEI